MSGIYFEVLGHMLCHLAQCVVSQVKKYTLQRVLTRENGT